MSQLDILQYAPLYIFTGFYLTSFRGTLKTAASWGAFEFGFDTKKPIFKLFFCSGPLLILAPVLMYCFASQIIMILPSKLAVYSNNVFLTILDITVICILLSLFPLATKHLWCVIAKAVEKRFHAGWLNKSIDPTKLPLDIYSWQVIILVSITLFLVISLFGKQLGSVFGENLFSKVYIILYLSQFTVLHHTAKKRGYFYHSPRPRWIISPRMLLTLPWTIIFPAAFGLLIWPLVYFPSKFNRFFLIPYLLLAWPFPYWMNQGILWLARKREWAPQKDCPEIYQGRSTWWIFCFLVSLVCMIILALIFGKIDYTVTLDSII